MGNETSQQIQDQPAEAKLQNGAANGHVPVEDTSETVACEAAVQQNSELPSLATKEASPPSGNGVDGGKNHINGGPPAPKSVVLLSSSKTVSPSTDATEDPSQQPVTIKASVEGEASLQCLEPTVEKPPVLDSTPKEEEPNQKVKKRHRLFGKVFKNKNKSEIDKEPTVVEYNSPSEVQDPPAEAQVQTNGLNSETGPLLGDQKDYVGDEAETPTEEAISCPNVETILRKEDEIFQFSNTNEETADNDLTTELPSTELSPEEIIPQFPEEETETLIYKLELSGTGALEASEPVGTIKHAEENRLKSDEEWNSQKPENSIVLQEVKMVFPVETEAQIGSADDITHLPEDIPNIIEVCTSLEPVITETSECSSLEPTNNVDTTDSTAEPPSTEVFTEEMIPPFLEEETETLHMIDELEFSRTGKPEASEPVGTIEHAEENSLKSDEKLNSFMPENNTGLPEVENVFQVESANETETEISEDATQQPEDKPNMLVRCTLTEEPEFLLTANEEIPQGPVEETEKMLTINELELPETHIPVASLSDEAKLVGDDQHTAFTEVVESVLSIITEDLTAFEACEPPSGEESSEEISLQVPEEEAEILWTDIVDVTFETDPKSIEEINICVPESSTEQPKYDPKSESTVQPVITDGALTTSDVGTEVSTEGNQSSTREEANLHCKEMETGIVETNTMQRVYDSKSIYPIITEEKCETTSSEPVLTCIEDPVEDESPESKDELGCLEPGVIPESLPKVPSVDLDVPEHKEIDVPLHSAADTSVKEESSTTEPEMEMGSTDDNLTQNGESVFQSNNTEEGPESSREADIGLASKDLTALNNNTVNSAMDDENNQNDVKPIVPKEELEIMPVATQSDIKETEIPEISSPVPAIIKEFPEHIIPKSVDEFEPEDVEGTTAVGEATEGPSPNGTPAGGEVLEVDGEAIPQVDTEEQESLAEESPVMNFFKTLVTPSKAPKEEGAPPAAPVEEVKVSEEPKPETSPETSPAGPSMAEPKAAAPSVKISVGGPFGKLFRSKSSKGVKPETTTEPKQEVDATKAPKSPLPPPPPEPPKLELKGESAAIAVNSAQKEAPKDAVKEPEAASKQNPSKGSSFLKLFHPKEEEKQEEAEPQPVEEEVTETAADVRVTPGQSPKAEKKSGKSNFISRFKPATPDTKAKEGTSPVVVATITMDAAQAVAVRVEPRPAAEVEKKRIVKPEAVPVSEASQQRKDGTSSLDRKLQKRHSINMFFKSLAPKRQCDAGVQTDPVTIIYPAK